MAERSRSHNSQRMKGYVYILECSDGSYYTGSTIELEKRINQHKDGRGANHTKKRLPVTLVYVEEYLSITSAFEREKQIQGWSRAKKEALIDGKFDALPNLSECKNETNFKYYKEEK
ncbi:GIY-YIG nuclease family protein [Flagellimonas lutimaris]|uniref:GIY-YIG nuclease family protein n=1 Tax=Flagellimonas TaxID=444459 RepID=UPI00269901D5